MAAFLSISRLSPGHSLSPKWVLQYLQVLLTGVTNRGIYDTYRLEEVGCRP
jgi:hypothetical protein